MMFLLRCITLFMTVTLCCNVFAWNALGHMVVANIAYQKVTPPVRAKLDKMIINFSKEYPQDSNLMSMAAWPDALRGQKVELFTHWHYIDLALSADATPLKNLTDTDNAVWAINSIKPVIKNLRANPYEQARFLAFLVHIVADIHQPLHTASRISVNHPDGDRGGNLFSVRLASGTGQMVSLHKLWDNGAGYLEGDASTNNAELLARRLIESYPESTFGTNITNLDPAVWANEGLTLASAAVYNTPENQIPSTQYLESEKHIVQQQLALAGYRLANLLNVLLAEPNGFS